MPQPRIGLDNPAFQGRLRTSTRQAAYSPIQRRSYLISDFDQPLASRSRPVQPVNEPRTFTRPLPSGVIKTLQDAHQVVPPTAGTPPSKHSKLQLGLVGMAGLIFAVGVAVSWQGFRVNHDAGAQVAALSKAAAKRTPVVPDTNKPSAQAIGSYVVAPDAPRYLKIAKLGISARVMQVGVDTSGALGTPNNVYDTAWYTGSAKPGQPGAVLIDGHVSSWSTPGVFYRLNKLVASDQIQIVRGDGSTISYEVVKTQVYNANKVDMQAAMTPISGTSGLNLISCTGHVVKGTSQFNERVIVFTKLVSN